MFKEPNPISCVAVEPKTSRMLDSFSCELLALSNLLFTGADTKEIDRSWTVLQKVGLQLDGCWETVSPISAEKNQHAEIERITYFANRIVFAPHGLILLTEQSNRVDGIFCSIDSVDSPRESGHYQIEFTTLNRSLKKLTDWRGCAAGRFMMTEPRVVDEESKTRAEEIRFSQDAYQQGNFSSILREIALDVGNELPILLGFNQIYPLHNATLLRTSCACPDKENEYSDPLTRALSIANPDSPAHRALLRSKTSEDQYLLALRTGQFYDQLVGTVEAVSGCWDDDRLNGAALILADILADGEAEMQLDPEDRATTLNKFGRACLYTALIKNEQDALEIENLIRDQTETSILEIVNRIRAHLRRQLTANE